MIFNHKICFFFLFISFQNILAQDFVDQKFEYDSILNVTYGYARGYDGEMDTLALDIFIPQCSNATSLKKWPLMVWVHGGAFLTGSRKDPGIVSFCRNFARRGYVTISVDYRMGFVSDEKLWSCNYPNYNCMFATDSAEWIRAWYRGVQDVKGAIRYMVNQAPGYGIDKDNIVVAGESAGSFLSLGVALLDTSIEKPPHAFALDSVPPPNNKNLSCAYHLDLATGNKWIQRPDLGDIDGDIQKTAPHYTIRAVGNLYGGIFQNLFLHRAYGKEIPAIYSFHQPCDIVVPIDSGPVFWGVSWCMSNGYGCYPIANTQARVYGAKSLSRWNDQLGKSHEMKEEYGTRNFPYSYLLGAGSCVDQVSNPCHFYDNRNLRESNFSKFVAAQLNVSNLCDSSQVSIQAHDGLGWRFFPNPAHENILIFSPHHFHGKLEIFDIQGRICKTQYHDFYENTLVDLSELPAGLLFIRISDPLSQAVTQKMIWHSL